MVGLTWARIGHAQNKPICMLHVDDAEDLAATHNGGYLRAICWPCRHGP
jgi:hypothetical protein